MVKIVKFETKKALKEAVKNNEDFFINDPSMFNPTSCYASQLKNNDGICVTNHPKRSWFATIKKINGMLKVS